MEWISDPQIWIAFATLLALEVVLGIDNVIFIAILADKLPEHQRGKARNLGLGLAMVIRILLLLSIAWIARLTTPLFAVVGHEISGRDLILILGGLFLIAKSTRTPRSNCARCSRRRTSWAWPASCGATCATTPSSATARTSTPAPT